MRIVFFVTGRDQDGLGHVSRSVGLAIELRSMGHSINFTGPLSELALKKIKNAQIQHSCDPQSDMDAVVIDAIEIDDEFMPWFSGFKKNRVLISPTFNQPQFVDFMFSRVTTSTANSVARFGGTVFINPMYAFSCICVNNKLSQPVENVHTVGICISGGKSYVDIKTIMRGLEAIESIRKVIIVGSDIPMLDDMYPFQVFQYSKMADLWGIFEEIDLLFTGDGVTMFEGIARGLPTVSIGRDVALEKNRFFYDEKWCAYLSAESLQSEAVCKVVSDLSWYRLIDCDLTSYNNVIAKEIDRVIHDA
jgi:hypothetical protein